MIELAATLWIIIEVVLPIILLIGAIIIGVLGVLFIVINVFLPKRKSFIEKFMEETTFDKMEKRKKESELNKNANENKNNIGVTKKTTSKELLHGLSIIIIVIILCIIGVGLKLFFGTTI